MAFCPFHAHLEVLPGSKLLDVSDYAEGLTHIGLILDSHGEVERGFSF